MDTLFCMALRHLRKAFVQFNPSDPKAVSARELLQRLTGDKAQKSNPACNVQFDIAEDGQPGKAFVELTFNDGAEIKVLTADYPVVDLSRMIDRKGNEMELKQVLSEVKGFDPWKAENRLGSKPS